MRGFDCHGWPPAMYRFFDADGRLLYVGATYDLPTRIGAHRVNAFWWPLVARTRWQLFPTVEAALEAEREAIATEHPRFNVRSRPWPSKPDEIQDMITALENGASPTTTYTLNRIARLRQRLTFAEAS